MTAFLIGAYMIGVMFIGGIMLMWFVFDWLCGTTTSPIYHVLVFFISMCITGAYEWYALVFLDWIAEKLDL